MGRRLPIFILLLLKIISAGATHIVGGEFEILHVEGNRYKFRQIQYFDVVNGNPQAEDPVIDASIFRKRDNAFVQNVSLPQIRKTLVRYTNPNCSDDRLVTRKIEYEIIVTLPIENYSDPQGYYLVWERCCRNDIITNIVLPDQTGQTFFLEFPAIVKDGEPFINSSPQLFPPLSDYACVNQFYYADFQGSDPDGDSLVYSLVAPLDVHNRGNALPPPQPLPIPDVIWIEGINDAYQVPGDPTLMVSKEGLLTLTPSEEGLFVFSVKCEEFRDGHKIGEVRRDFQLFVIDCQLPGAKPEILVKQPGSETYTGSPANLNFITTEEKCLEFLAKDEDGMEIISLRAKAVNFDMDLSDLLPVDKAIIEDPEDSLTFTICLPECPYIWNEPYIIDLIAMDNSCPQPQMDTVRLIVTVEPPPNSPPKFLNPPDTEELYINIDEGETIDLSFNVEDIDLDQMILLVETLDFGLDTFGIEVNPIINEAGKLDFDFFWFTDCQQYPFRDKSDFRFKFIVEDLDFCEREQPDSIILNVHVNLPENRSPQILLEGNASDRDMDIRIEDNLSFKVTAVDADPKDTLSLTAVGVGYELGRMNMVFQEQIGFSSVESDFNWELGCYTVDLNTTDSLLVYFIAEDVDKCKVRSGDTLSVRFNIYPPLNEPPEIYIPAYPGDTLFSVYAGETVNLELLGEDPDNDSISIHLLEGQSAFELTSDPFIPVGGSSPLWVPFIWPTNCSLLGEDFSAETYIFSVVINDHQCLVPKSDTLNFSIEVSDRPADFDFLPPNVFTPNHMDAYNETFYIPDLPVDNCEGEFDRIVIVNRWGREVFSSTSRDFNWDGNDVTTGVYFYSLHYTHKLFRGTVSVIR